ncbi:hypothetical protein [Pedobacter sp. NJ-S-72]
MAAELAIGVSEGLFQTSAGMLESVGKTVANFLEILMEPVYIAPEPDPFKRKKKKKKKGQSQDQSYGHQM